MSHAGRGRGPAGRAVPGHRRHIHVQPARRGRRRRWSRTSTVVDAGPDQVRAHDHGKDGRPRQGERRHAVRCVRRRLGPRRPDGGRRPGPHVRCDRREFLAWEDELYRANQPSVYDPSIPGVVTVDAHRAQNVLGSRWTGGSRSRSPSDSSHRPESSIIVDARSTRSFNITMDANRVPIGQTRFATDQADADPGAGIASCTSRSRSSAARPPITFTKACAPTNPRQRRDDDLHDHGANTDIRGRDLPDQGRPAEPLRLIKAASSAPRLTTTTASSLTARCSAARAADRRRRRAPGRARRPATCRCPSSASRPSRLRRRAIVNLRRPAVHVRRRRLGHDRLQSATATRSSAAAPAPTSSFINQNLPDRAPPNNVLAPFWTDLNLGLRRRRCGSDR